MKRAKQLEEFRDLSDQELQDKLKELKGELFNLRFQMATGQVSNTMVVREVKKNIARVQTILRERELRQAQ
ncbi:50S ribosomal protein L29 [Gehongia tenuis]|jgi:large subunit ribosomal protein L29|uniref:Large ribosomal subunit protein uL29 n=1 Tax=Gehongia tenuis TaxID=2763655 RepID=A0A926HL23_9FIRM|nr:50S ribosomal protein L29 [Gehongia tenuis]MBC8531602.1 50S ribosomal protein L29 [Gehongia tenuis]